MLKTLSSFAALSLCGTIVLSLLPEGGLKRTARMAAGLLMLMCWAEGVAALLQVELPDIQPAAALSSTAYSVTEAASGACDALAGRLEALP